MFAFLLQGLNPKPYNITPLRAILMLPTSALVVRYTPDIRDTTSGTGNVHAARERMCGYTRKYVFAILFHHVCQHAEAVISVDASQSRVTMRVKDTVSVMWNSNQE